jgi:hypothetical protein
MSYPEILGETIASCSSVHTAISDAKHPCHKVVTWQKTQLIELKDVRTYFDTPAHRPEAWTGDLENAPIIFLASNPSFNPDENYPDWTEAWNGPDIREFATRRFIDEGERSFGAIDSGPNRDKTYLKNNLPSDNSVPYWREIRGRVAELLGKEVDQVSAHSDFVMTELVHCKSFKEIGVSEALQHCTQNYLNDIFRTSPASIVIVMGKKPAEQLVKLFPEIPNTWGAWKDDQTKTQRGFWPKKDEIESAIKDGRWTPAEQRKHTTEIKIGGMLRKVIWLPRPNSSLPRTLAEPLISSEVLEYWRENLKEK